MYRLFLYLPSEFPPEEKKTTTMKVKFGVIIIDGRGKLGGHVASKNRAGSFFRTKVTPVNPQTSYQLRIRNRFTGISQAWRGIEQTARDAWNAAVSDYARTDIFGDLRNPTGFNLYQKLNNNLSTVGAPQITTPPLPQAVGKIVVIDLYLESYTFAVWIDLKNDVPVNTYGKVFMTAPLSPGINFAVAEYRLVTIFPPGTNYITNITNQYLTKFGKSIKIGQKAFAKVVAVNGTTGQAGTPSQASKIVIEQ